MATTHLQIPDIQANQNSKEVTANAAHDLLDKALNANVQVAVSVGVNNLTTTQARENFVIELTGSPGAGYTVEMPDTNKRTLVIVNSSDGTATVQNPSAGGTGQPVIAPGEASFFHFDGTDFFDFTALALTVASFLGLTDTPANFTGGSGKVVRVNAAESALEYILTAVKLPVVAATTAALTLATDVENGDTIDGVTLATGDRVLIKNQGTASENGVYIVNATGAPTRAEDFDDNTDVEGGVLVPVNTEGTQNGDTVWMLSDDDAVTVGTDALTFVQMLSAGTFLSLTDAPSSYTNQSGMAVRVNSAESALEFVPTDIKIPVRVATTAAGTLSTDFENGDSVDGVTLATGDRILIKNQSTASENGIYVVAATGSPTRALDFDANDADVIIGAIVTVVEGTNNAQTIWQHTSGTDVGTDNIVWSQVGGGTPLNVGTQATVQTTDATVTNIATIAVPSGSTISVRGFGMAQGPSQASVGFDFIATAHNAGGTTTLDGQTIRHMDDNTNGWTLTIDVDDTTDVIRLRANGAGSTTIDWRLRYETIEEA